MDIELTPNQEIAVSQFLQHLRGCGIGWGDELFAQFENILDPEDIDDSLSLTAYYRELMNLPADTKRVVIQNVILAWNSNKNPLTLYESLQKIIYLKICNIVEFHFINVFYNVFAYFGGLNNQDVQIVSLHPYYYTIEFGNFNNISIHMSTLDEPKQYVGFSVECELLESRFPNASGMDVNDFKPLFDYILDYSSKNHCHWIQYRSTLSANFFAYIPGLVIEVVDLEYFDGSGVGAQVCSNCKNFYYDSWTTQNSCRLWNNWTDPDDSCSYFNEDYYELLEQGININRRDDY